MFPELRILSSKQLVNLIKESNENGERFCFILGSGASVESGIPSGNTLEMQWMDHIMGDPKYAGDIRKTAACLYNANLIEHTLDEIEGAWKKAKETRKSIPSVYYFDIYKLRFFPSRRNGYRYLERIMDGREPSLGYHTLAKLLTETNQNNLVITTNFDSLVEDALFLYTNKKPLVVSHESLAGYIESDIQRPIIAKVHRGLMYEPFNTPETTDKLQPEWRDALNYAFNTYTPIVIGYAGGDRSLMAFLEEATTTMRNGVYWCYWEASGLPEEDIQAFVEGKKGYFVTIGGFDALMMEIGDLLYKDEITPSGTDEYLKKQYVDRVRQYNMQWDELNKNPELQEVLQPINKVEQTEEKKREKNQMLTAGDYVRRGNRAYDEGLYQQAIEGYTKAIEVDPHYPTAYSNRAVAYNNLKLHEKAIEDFTKAIEIDPNYAKAYSNRGFTYDCLGQQEKAIEDFTKAIEINPNYATAYSNRAATYNNLKQHKKAIEDCTKAIELDVNLVTAYNNRGFAYSRLGQYQKAIEDYTKAIEIDPNYATAYSNRAAAYNNLKQHKKAIEDCTKAIELDANLVNAYNNRGFAYSRLGQYQKAIEDYTKAIQLDPEYELAYCNRADAYRAMGEDSLAESDEKSAAELQPDT